MKSTKPPIESAIRSLKQRIDALRAFIGVVEPHLNKELSSALKAKSKDLLPAFLLMNRKAPADFPLPEDVLAKMTAACGNKVVFKETDVDGKKQVSMEVTRDLSEKLERAVDEIERSREHQLQLYESSLVSIVSSIEVFFAELFHAHFATTGLVPGAKERAFSYQELQDIGSLQEAKDLLIEGKIEEILRGPFKAWIGFVKESMGLSMSYLDSSIDVLTEACLRRNLVVHNSCFVNKIYMNRAPEKVRSKCEIGQRIVVDNDYVSKVLNAFELNCSLIGFEYWKKQSPIADERGDLLLEYAFDALIAGRYQTCEGFAFFLISDKKQPDSQITLGQLNYWLSLKKQNKWELVRASYEAADYSAKSLRFRAGLAALGRDADAFFKVAVEAKRAKEISSDEYARFPIFDYFRTDSRFRSLCGAQRKKSRKNA